MKKGIVTKEGSKFLVFGGSRLEPARNLTPELFTAIDKTQQDLIPLPRTDKKYKIVSRQSPTYLAAGVSKDGKMTGTVEIAQPEEFWSAIEVPDPGPGLSQQGPSAMARGRSTMSGGPLRFGCCRR